MALSEEKIRSYTLRLLQSRMRLLCTHGFYGLLLMHMRYGVDEEVETACTDGERITFGTAFLEKLDDRELDYVMMHEVLHVVLQHCFRGAGHQPERFNIACDIVVNSNILLENQMNLRSISLREYGGACMHLAPDGKEGYEYTAEQVYQMLPPVSPEGESRSGAGSSDKKQGKASGKMQEGGGWDDHTSWGDSEENTDMLRDMWEKRLADACEAISIRDPSNQRGLLPLFAERMLKELRHPQTDWRQILNEFIQEEITDYSFSPPDRRFGDSPFFLPDHNEKADTVERILFMIDTSGSMSDDMITAAYSEVKGALDQFGGRLTGWLGFFDADVIEPKPFSNVDELSIIRPKGGGGTDFACIFEYIFTRMDEPLPVSIIILTDGYAPFPPEKEARGIPVLWLICNEKAEPPWGKLARIETEE